MPRNFTLASSFSGVRRRAKMLYALFALLGFIFVLTMLLLAVSLSPQQEKEMALHNEVPSLSLFLLTNKPLTSQQHKRRRVLWKDKMGQEDFFPNQNNSPSTGLEIPHHSVKLKGTPTTSSMNYNQLDNEHSVNLPAWMVEYAAWHTKTRKELDRSSGWSNQKLLVVVAANDRAEGLSDRLRSLPFLLWEAHQVKRLLLIQWLRPWPLEEFLVPPSDGVDWRVPNALDFGKTSRGVVWHRYRRFGFNAIATEQKYENCQVIMTQPNPYTFLNGMDLVYATLHQTMSNEQLSNIYHSLFTPSTPVQKLLDETMQRLGLTPKKYFGLHIRARYPDFAVHNKLIPNNWNATVALEDSKQLKRRNVMTDPVGLAVDKAGIKETEQVANLVRGLGASAVQCARSNLPNDMQPAPTPIYFASDTNFVVQIAMNQSERIVGYVTQSEKLHMNVENDQNKHSPSDFYPAIVDVWILSQAQCLVVGHGGYALFAALLGGSGNCVVFHSMQNEYVVHYLPKGYVTIRNVTFCKPQDSVMLQELDEFVQNKRRDLPALQWFVGS